MIHATATAFIVGALLDLLLGDPRWLPHPIRGMGLLVQALERLLRTVLYAISGRIPLLASVQGGVAEQSIKRREASADSEAGVVFRMRTKRKTTPAASVSVASRYFLDDAATPPCGDARRGITRTTIAGCILAGLVLVIAVAVTILSLHWGGMPAAAYWIFTCLAVRSLDQESKRVVEALRADDLHRARKLVACLVGRDTQGLSEKEVTRAVFETVAENMSDAVVAPLFYLAILGVPGMVAYKAVNTMDSMIGYKDERYIRFGWAAARLDDIANYVPARITAGLIVFSAALIRLEWRRAITVVFRDAHLQPSPNAGYPEAALAGALGVQLGGLNYYFGRPVQKPFLGDPREDLNWSRFSQVRLLMYLVAAVSYLVVGLSLL